ncbi:Choline kinase [Cyclonatronum proteinivorum]|uniref:Choline kinase n=1 Tax=Cyclonatronum proteinivorum TaxID=1457365 RepID=A0A345UJ62_9BACT|nr:phosphocholine cytidylyltransferase family protein [Cyclonatronum proteinivorum]AXJ00514.1 Choline kinase [Cyclonatronum proteinivorum]
MIRTAVLLVAGLGSRLGEHTANIPKCLIEVDGQPLLDRTIQALLDQGITKIIIVGGYKADVLEAFLAQRNYAATITVTYNHHYASSNNIYSLWIAFNLLRLNEGFLLLEGDLIFESHILSAFLKESAIALDIYKPEIHSGTTAELSASGYLKSLFFRPELPEAPLIYKTVNIYSFEADFAEHLFYTLDRFIQNGRTQIYYEYAIDEVIKKYGHKLKLVDFSEVFWDEIDSETDLHRVEAHIAQFKLQDSSVQKQ